MTGRSRGRGRGRGGFKSASNYAKKRPSPTSDTEDPTSRYSKKSKPTVNDDEDSDPESTEPFIPTLKTDSDGNPYIPLKPNSTRRLTLSTFKSQTLLSVREYYTNDAGDFLPGKKGIALTIEQFDALVKGLPLLEGALREKGVEGVGRPEYGDGVKGVGKEEGKAEKEEENEDSEEVQEDDNNGDEEE